MIAGAGFMAGLTGMIRHASAGLHPFEVAFFRSLFGLMFMLPWLMRGGVLRLRTQRLGLYTVRALVGLLAMLCWFYALSLTPLADAVALSFTSPLFATVGAALVLREDVRRERAPFARGTGAGLRRGAGRDGAHDQGAVANRTGQRHRNLHDALHDAAHLGPGAVRVVAALAAVATLGNLSVTRAFAAAEASAVVPYDFVRLPVVALIGFVAFAEVPDLWTWIGAAVIAGSSVYIARREARLERAGRRPDRAGGSAPSPGAGGP
jgi:drug/metabolite transporter (DMT)-like permease